MIYTADKLGKYKGADVVAEYMLKEKIPYMIGYAGHGAIGLLDSFYDKQDQIKIVWPRIETAAGFMADAYYRLTKVPLPVYVSTGPGPALSTCAVANAYYDSSAFLLITGEVTTDQFDTGALQEPYRQHPADFPSVVRNYVKQSYQATTVKQISAFLPKAFKLMQTGRPGPVHLEVPYDVYQTEGETVVPDPENWADSVSWRHGTEPHVITAILKKLKEAKRPLILAGGGVHVSEARDELLKFAECMNIPVYTSLMGKGAMAESHPLHLGVCGCWGHYPAVEAARNADVILVLGCRFSDLHTASWQPGFAYNIPATKLIQIDIDASEIARNYPVDMGVVGDIKTVLGQLIEKAKELNEPGKYDVWFKELNGYKKQWDDFVTPFKTCDDKPIDPRRLIYDIRKVAPKDAIMFSDVGNNQPWIEEFWGSEVPGTHFTAGGFAAMGFGVCGVLGAKLARPETTCINVCGDGGFLMMPHAVATAVQYNLPAVWIIMNNYAIGAIRDLQRFYFGGRQIGTNFETYEGTKYHDGELWNPDFAAMAKSMGGEGVRVENPGDIAPAVEAAIKSQKPTVIDVIINRDIPVPLTSTWQMPPIPPALPTFGKIKIR
ncbi:Acetolactate synthase large subunit [Pelotomaculum schinkii]|uniref:Acetolactate synthase large subunit n=1 Tax=Pelotomaculum schinkii TaxID=78350 RepID=A0A4Y7RAU4_9FIRM|nr:thiamine pyrophosphate-binding protein [Pelotomaculum schinkii]TEB06108.1 Acetolactate synthase large subunit [Pelotomaculum schinkii]